MAAVHRSLGFLGDGVRALAIACRTRNKHDFDGQRKSDGNRRLAHLPTLALALAARFEVLLPSSLPCLSVLNSLDCFG